MPRTVTIRQTHLIPASPKQVYDAYLNAKKHSDFTGSKATCTPKVGGRFSAWDGYITGRNVALEAGKKIVQEWQTTEWPEGYGPSILEITLEENKEGGGITKLTMVHSKVPAGQAEDYRQGWMDYYWDPLKAYFQKKT